MRANLKLFLQATLLYVFSYLLSGGVFYQLITKQFYVGSHPIFAGFLRSEANAEEWAHVSVWMGPALLTRSAMIVAVLLPFVDTLRALAATRRVALIFTQLFVMTHLAAAAPSPSNLEGLIYLRPEYLGVVPFLLTQPEMIAQCLLFALGLSWLVSRKAALATALAPR